MKNIRGFAVTVSASVGANVIYAITESLDLARDLKCQVKLIFNDKLLRCNADDRVEDVLARDWLD